MLAGGGSSIGIGVATLSGLGPPNRSKRGKASTTAGLASRLARHEQLSSLGPPFGDEQQRVPHQSVCGSRNHRTYWRHEIHPETSAIGRAPKRTYYHAALGMTRLNVTERADSALGATQQPGL
jgi:hypothetical protein